MILNQIDSGKPCPRDVARLKERIPDDSLMCYIEVYAWHLAKVLDRLEALETLEASVHESCTWLLRVIERPKVVKRSRERKT